MLRASLRAFGLMTLPGGHRSSRPRPRPQADASKAQWYKEHRQRHACEGRQAEGSKVRRRHRHSAALNRALGTVGIGRRGTLMIDANSLRIAAAVCSVIGSVLLAWRVKGLLDALAFVAKAHEANIQQLMSSSGDVFNFSGSPKHIQRATKYWLLLLGFGFLGLSGLLNIFAFTIASGP